MVVCGLEFRVWVSWLRIRVVSSLRLHAVFLRHTMKTDGFWESWRCSLGVEGL